MNLIRNGNFEQWPLGTTFAIPEGASNVSLLEDWDYKGIGSEQPAVDITREAFSFGNTLAEGAPNYFLQVSPQTAPASGSLLASYLRYSVRDDLTLINRVGVLNFWADTSVDREIVVQVVRRFIGGGGPGGNAEVVVGTKSFQLRRGWRKYQFDVRFPTYVGATHDVDNDVTDIRFYFQGDSSNLGNQAIPWKAATLKFSQVALVPYGIIDFDVDTPAEAQSAGSGDGYELEAAKDGVTDTLAAWTAALAERDTIRLTPGTYYISDNLTISHSKTVIFERGAQVRVANNKKFSITGQVTAGRYQIFDYTLGGKCVFNSVSIGSNSRTDEIYPEWYGAVGDNNTNNDSALGRILDNTLASGENKQPVRFGIGYYNFVFGFAMRTKTRLVGSNFRQTRLQLGPGGAVSGTARLITLPNNTDNIFFEGLQFAVFSPAAGVQTIGIGHANSTDQTNTLSIRDCVFSQFNRAAIDIGRALWSDIKSTEFDSISNLISLGGTGAGSATCVNVSGYANAIEINELCRAGQCEQFLKTVSSASLTVENCSFEQSDATVDAITGKSHFIDATGWNIRIVNNYFEGVRADDGTGTANIALVNIGASSRSVKINNNYMTGLRPGGVASVTRAYVRIGASNLAGMVSENTFYGNPILFIVVNGSAAKISAPQNLYLNDLGVPYTTFSSIRSRMSPQVTDFTLEDGVHFCRTVAARAITSSAGIQFLQYFGRERGSGIPGAAGDGIGARYQITRSDESLVTAAEEWVEWVTASAGTESSDRVFRTVRTSALTESLRIRGLGGITVSGGIHSTTRESAVDTNVTQADSCVILTATGKIASIINSDNLPIGIEFEFILSIGSAGTGTIAFVNSSDAIRPSGALNYPLSADGKYVKLKLVKANTWVILANN